MKNYIFLLPGLLLLAGCKGVYTEVDKEDFERKPESETNRLLADFKGDCLELDRQKFEEVFVLNSSSIYQAIYYQGSDTEYHYFSSQWEDFSDKTLKVSIKDLTVNHPMDRDSDPVLLSPLRQDEISKGFVVFREPQPEPIPRSRGMRGSSTRNIPTRVIRPITPRGVSTSAPQVREFKTREELQKYLQAQQMEAIRSGKPPLPVPLTQEMDRKLVEEGVLPPQKKGSVE